MLKLNHLTGFGSGAAAAAGGDVTSYVFDGTGDYLSIPDHADWDFPAGDFTIECFIRVPDASPSTTEYIWSQRVSGDNNNNLSFELGELTWIVREGGSNIVNVKASVSGITINTWHHVAVVRENDDYYIYIDGVDKFDTGTNPDTSDRGAFAAPIHIGFDGNSSGYFNGYIDEYRVSNTARYPSGTTFTPTTTQFVSDANTKLLIHGGEAIASGTTGSGATFVDSGNTGHTVTENGDAQRDIATYKF